MADKDFRRDWAQEQARQKLRDMRGQGLSDVRIGKKIGGSEPISGVFIGAVLRESDPKPVSKRVWDGLIENTDFKPVPPGSAVAPQQTEKVSHGPSPDLTAAVVRLEQQVAGLVSAQVMLLQRLVWYFGIGKRSAKAHDGRRTLCYAIAQGVKSGEQVGMLRFHRWGDRCSRGAAPDFLAWRKGQRNELDWHQVSTMPPNYQQAHTFVP